MKKEQYSIEFIKEKALKEKETIYFQYDNANNIEIVSKDDFFSMTKHIKDKTSQKKVEVHFYPDYATPEGTIESGKINQIER